MEVINIEESTPLEAGHLYWIRLSKQDNDIVVGEYAHSERDTNAPIFWIIGCEVSFSAYYVGPKIIKPKINIVNDITETKETTDE